MPFSYKGTVLAPLIPSSFVQDAEMKLEQATVLNRLSEVERVVEEACGAMDDIAVGLQVD